MGEQWESRGPLTGAVQHFPLVSFSTMTDSGFGHPWLRGWSCWTAWVELGGYRTYCLA